MSSQLKILVFMGLLVACPSTMLAQNPDEASAKPKKDNGATTSSAPVEETYKIGPQDVLKIDVWKEPDITRQVTVRPDGKISLPLLDDVPAAGYTPQELATTIRQGLKKFINEPQVTVTVAEINSRRAYVTGEVIHPGALALLPEMTVLQALSSCGGFTQFANTKKIYILRVENKKQIRVPLNYKEVVSGRKPEKNLLLQPGDTIVVP